MLNTQTNNQPTATTTGQQPDLSTQSLPSTNRSNIFTNTARAIAMSAALGGGESLQAQALPVYEPAPKVAPAVSGANVSAAVVNTATNQLPTLSTLPTFDPASVQQFIVTQVPQPPPAGAPAPAPKMIVTTCDVSTMERRPFCMDDEGNVWLINGEGSQLKRPGSSVQGPPSKGSVLQAFAYAKEQLIKQNGGKIPDGYEAHVWLERGGRFRPTSYLLNLDAIPAVADLGKSSFQKADADTHTGNAMQQIHDGIEVHVANDQGAFTFNFMARGGGPLRMTVKLQPAK